MFHYLRFEVAEALGARNRLKGLRIVTNTGDFQEERWFMGVASRLFIFAPYGGNFAVHHQLDLVIGVAAQMRGIEALALGCRMDYENCEVLLHTPSEQRVSACASCAVGCRNLFMVGGVPLRSVTDLVSRDELIHAGSWSECLTPQNFEDATLDDIPIGRWVLSSLLTAFQVSRKALERPELLPFYRALLRNSALSAYAVTRVIRDFKPEVSVVFNGRFAPYRTAFELLRRAGVRVITHERGFSDNSFVFFDNRTINDVEGFIEIARPWTDIALKREEAERVSDYIRAREDGQGFNCPAFVTYHTEEDAVRRKLGVGSEKLFGFFTSTESELPPELADMQLPLLERFMDAARSRPDVTLVIRHHPNLAGSKETPPDYAFVGRLYAMLSEASDNVRCIMPTEKLSTYGLMWHLSGAVAPVSSVGLELSSRGVCSMTSAKVLYRFAQAMTFDEVSDVDASHAMESLLAMGETFDVENLQRAYRLLYSYIERGSVRFRSIGIQSHYAPDLKSSFVEDIALGRDPALSRLLDGMFSGGSIYPQPDATDVERSDQQERQYLGERRVGILQKRAEVYRRSLSVPRSQLPVLRLCCVPRLSHYPDVFGERHTHVQQCEVDVRAGNMFELLLDRVARSDCALVTFVDPAASHDGNFVSSGLEFFHSHSDKSMLVRGMWLADRGGEVYSEVLTARTGTPSFEWINETFCRDQDVLRLLSLGLYRRHTAHSLLETLSLTCEPEARVRLILNSWTHWSAHVDLNQCGITFLSR